MGARVVVVGVGVVVLGSGVAVDEELAVEVGGGGGGAAALGRLVAVGDGGGVGMGAGRVHAVRVASEVDLALEGAAADVAGERLEAGVLAAVRDQVGGLAEGLAADYALVWLFT